MTDDSETMTGRLRRHCAGKLGAVEASVWQATAYRLLNGQLTSFADFTAGDGPPEVLIRCPDSVRDSFEQRGLPLVVPERMKWQTQGWKWLDAPLDGSIPEAALVELLDASYELAVLALKDGERQKLALLAGAPKDDDKALLLDLIRQSNLARYESEVVALARPSFTLRTAPVADADLALGQSRIGGCPDLPAGIDWPLHSSGKSLTFLTQLRCSELPRLKAMGTIPWPEHCPTSGFLVVFSVFGWLRPGDSDPDLPDGPTKADWTQVFFVADESVPLARRETPATVNQFPAVQVSFEPTLELPIALNQEAAVARLGWSEDVVEKLETLADQYRSIRDHIRKYPHRHRLFGYANDDQGLPGEVAERDLMLLLQLGSDDRAEMSWGDDGLFDIWIPLDDWINRDFARIVVGDQSC